MDNLADRFWDKVVFGNGCWNWSGYVATSGRQAGYGFFHANHAESMKPVHRLAYCLAHNIEYTAMRGTPIAQACKNKLCCNPAHLRETTYAYNSARRNTNESKTIKSLGVVRTDNVDRDRQSGNARKQNTVRPDKGSVSPISLYRKAEASKSAHKPILYLA